MDRDFLERELVTWIELTEEFERIKFSAGASAEKRRQEIVDELFDRHMTTMRIVKKFINPGKPTLVYRQYQIKDTKYVETVTGRTLVAQALGALRRGREVQKALGPAAPSLSADQFHSEVWKPAADLWQDGHHGMAVQRAATNLSGRVQDLIRRYDVSDATLMQQAFGAGDPKPGEVRLRWPGESTNLTVKAMNDGIRNFAIGCFQGIRNPLTHTVDDVPKQEALEKLAALSVLARWIDECVSITSQIPSPGIDATLK